MSQKQTTETDLGEEQLTLFTLLWLRLCLLISWSVLTHQMAFRTVAVSSENVDQYRLHRTICMFLNGVLVCFVLFLSGSRVAVITLPQGDRAIV